MEDGMDNGSDVRVDVLATVDITAAGMKFNYYPDKSSDDLRREIRAMQYTLLEREVGRYRGVLPADMSLYESDTAPRVGCTLVVHIDEKNWSLDVYAPGYAPVGPVGLISGYAPRRHGSIGIAIEALIRQGFDWRHAVPAMKRAEQAYSESAGSSVTR